MKRMLLFMRQINCALYHTRLQLYCQLYAYIHIHEKYANLMQLIIYCSIMSNSI